jgi:hypothetical protein
MPKLIAAHKEGKGGSPGPSGPLPPARLHDLRRVHATPLLSAGVPAQVVAERLGHVEPSITLRVYAHVIRQQVADVAEVFARQVGDIDEALDDHDLRSLARPRVSKSVSKPGGQMRTVVNNKGPDSA